MATSPAETTGQAADTAPTAATGRPVAAATAGIT